MSIQRWHDDGRCFRDPEGDWVNYADHVAEVERVGTINSAVIAYFQREATDAMRAACIKAVEDEAYVPIKRTGRFIITRNTKLWYQRENWTLHGWLSHKAKALDALKEVQP